MDDKANTGCDLLVFAAHPDDAELCCGGLLLLSARQGWRTGVIDLTRGEMGSLGTPELRVQEAEAASKVLGLSVRRNLGLPDGHLSDCDEYREIMVRTIRELRPQVVIGPPPEDHHADHMAVAQLLKQSYFFSGVRKYAPDLEPWRPKALLQHYSSRPIRPQLIVDVTDVIEQRFEAIRCYKSQFDIPQPKDFPIRLASSHFLDSLKGSLMHYGSQIGVQYGEPYASETPLSVGDLVGLFSHEPWKDR